MIELYQFSNIENIPDYSPFCAKVEIFLKVNGIDYVRKLGDIRKTPKKKLPMIKDGDRIVCDSEHIIHYLSDKYSVDLDSDLSDEQRAIAYGIRKTIDEYLYFILVYSRWIDPQGWQGLQPILAQRMPKLLGAILPKLIRRYVKKAVYSQGISRHSRDEVIAFAAEGAKALADLLGDKPFFLGENFTIVDASAFGFLQNAVGPGTFLAEQMAKYPNLGAYVERLLEKYYR